MSAPPPVLADPGLGPATGPTFALAESAVSPSTYDVPRSFLWLADASVQLLALVTAWFLLPVAHPWFAAETAGSLRWLRWLAFPPSSPLSDRMPLGDLAWIPLVAVPSTVLAMQVLGGYGQLLRQTRLRVVAVSLAAPTVGLSFVTLALTAVKSQETSRALIFSFTLLTATMFLAYRFAVRLYKRRRLLAGHYTRNVVMVGSAAARERLARHFASGAAPEMRRLFGYLSCGTDFEGWPPQPAGVDMPYLGKVEDLADLLVHLPIHEVVTVQAAEAPWLPRVMEQCGYFNVTLRLVPEALLFLQPSDVQFSYTPGALGLPEIELRPRHLGSEALFVKRVFDIVVSAVLLVLLSPLFAVIAAVIKLSTPHLPVFYPWRVIGYKGRPFTGYKFTTMVADADTRKADLMALNEMSGPVFKMKEDPRITRAGKWLRKYSLNELPQLWSVLKGDMSLVGPRPAYPNELARYELWHKRKLCVQPGITCLWQVRGRNRISRFDDWVRMDFEYIDNWSLWLDCRILARTAWAVFRGSGW